MLQCSKLVPAARLQRFKNSYLLKAICSVTKTRVKICGITSVEQARWAVDAGADAIGLVFYEPSPRFVNLTLAAEIAASVPAFVTVVALFRNAEAGQVQHVCKRVQPDMLQFHGDEPVEFCEQFDRPWMKALGMNDMAAPAEVELAAQPFSKARGLLLDSHSGKKAGGSGKAFDWSLVPENMRGRFVLAGGLSPQNVAEGVARLRPWAVDVSSGVESSPGIKSKAKIVAFMAALNQVDADLYGQ